MVIAIHHRKGSFSERWISYCNEHNIEYKIVNAYSSDIMDQVKGCDAFMWHFVHYDYRNSLFAKQLIYSMEMTGIKCFPNHFTSWHFDDKVGQKYLLESISAPLVPSHVFYSNDEALDWISKTSFPKVFKLRGGAGASNVKLVRTESEARKLVHKAFAKGFSQSSFRYKITEDLRKFRKGELTMFHFVKDISAYFLKNRVNHKMKHTEKGYAYFQDFIEDNNYDIRVVVIGNKAMGEQRMCRKGDFRASGSGDFRYIEIPEDVLKIAFDVAKRLRLQSVAFDFVFRKGEPLIVEMSYCFGTHGIQHCKYYYTDDLQKHEAENIDFCGWMVENLMAEL